MGFNCLKVTEPLWGGSLLFTAKFPGISGTRLIDLWKIKGQVDLGATQWFWTQDPWIGSLTPLGLWMLFNNNLETGVYKWVQFLIVINCVPWEERRFKSFSPSLTWINMIWIYSLINMHFGGYLFIQFGREISSFNFMQHFKDSRSNSS